MKFPLIFAYFLPWGKCKSSSLGFQIRPASFSWWWQKVSINSINLFISSIKKDCLAPQSQAADVWAVWNSPRGDVSGLFHHKIINVTDSKRKQQKCLLWWITTSSWFHTHKMYTTQNEREGEKLECVSHLFHMVSIFELFHSLNNDLSN